MPVQIDFLAPIRQAIAPLYGFVSVLLLACGVTVLVAVVTNIYLMLNTDMSPRERRRFYRMAGKAAALLLGSLTLIR
ncbi:hypothetical protein [Chromobacterium violaceum]|uniref:hypothetical protein n=1 Tax=Chromobacterium violaceum TaxID=536 RepID=UPI00194FB1BA|nr:hypothetical protein [Chromobacterium violaceum]QRO33980.1 hypothetical protein I6K04_04345 [Chromobacterium violaceum]QRQ16217.1 hypothetical protein I6K03_18385 [Chromobacterium violaceum]